MKKMQGVTLIELMIGIMVLAVLLGLGVPSFRDIMQRNRVTTTTNDIVTALQLARSEATKRRADVAVCRRNQAGSDCQGGSDWSAGWLVVNGSVPIRVWDAPQGNMAISGPAGQIVFGPTGSAAAAACIGVTLDGHRRRIDVNTIGRVSSTTGACPA